jgi:hypothetical protein
MITSSVTSPELATKNPRDHRCRPPILSGKLGNLEDQPFAASGLTQVLSIRPQLTGTLPLESLPQVARRHVRRAGDEQVDVVLADMALEDLDLQLRTDRAHDLAEPEADVASS